MIILAKFTGTLSKYRYDNLVLTILSHYDISRIDMTEFEFLQVVRWVNNCSGWKTSNISYKYFVMNLHLYGCWTMPSDSAETSTDYMLIDGDHYRFKHLKRQIRIGEILK